MPKTFEEKATTVVNTFESCNRDQQNEILIKLLLKCQPLQLRFLYAELKPLLAVDFVAYLPKELTEKIFFYLDAKDLCRIACCNKLWRERSNHDPVWQTLCKRKGWLRYGSDADLSAERPFSPDVITSISNTSPTYIPPNSVQSLVPICKWKDVYMRAHHLDINWATGKYTVTPLLKGHKEQISSLDSDGKILVSGSQDRTARVWDLHSLQCLHILDGHTEYVTCLKLKGNIVVTGCSDGIVRAYDVKTGRCLKKLQGHTSGVECLCFDGQTIVSAANDKTVRVWLYHSGKCQHVLRGHQDDIEFLCMYKDMAVSASWDETLKLWNLKKGICVHTLRGHTEVVYCCQFDKDMIVSGGGDNHIKIWDTETGYCRQTLMGHTGEVYCMKYNSEVIASGSADSTVRLWNHQGICINVMREHIGVVRCLCLYGPRLITGGDRKKIVVWDAKTGEKLNVVHRNPSLLHKMWVNDTKLVTASPESPGAMTVISFW
ncbi:F-box/WD repeat-containing protein 7-like [Ptychodera flava]|uniref:F-box/WD repeat-containing protein 7-like n=1 Tax=Ptychodera flava TaxID=63121 RepID=UPI00396A93D9